MIEYFVYEDWLNDKCIYVGSGQKHRIDQKGRNKAYNDFVGDRKIERRIIKKFSGEK